MITTYSAGQTLYYCIGHPCSDMKIEQFVTDNDSNHKEICKPELSRDVIFYTYDEAKKEIFSFLYREREDILNGMDDVRADLFKNRSGNLYDAQKEFKLFEKECCDKIRIIEAEMRKWR